jgi:dTDP-4-dehydrorhamnose reductase
VKFSRSCSFAVMCAHKKTVLVTGSNGLLGQKLSDLYLQLPDIRFIATGTGPNRHPSQELEYCSLDILNPEETREVLERYRPNVVIHTAAMTNVDACETQQEACMALNVHAVARLAQLSAELEYKLIHLSTDFIFPGTHPMYTEDETPEPLSFYGMSKWEGEKAVMAHAKDWCILRTVIVYGTVHNMSRSNIVLWAMQALEKGEPMKVVNDQFRTPTLAEDLAMGCRLAESKDARGIYNICGPDYMSILELVHRVADFFNFSTSHIIETESHSLGQPAKRPPITGLSIDKARKELGYEPHTFEEGLTLLAKQLAFAKK